jgi:large subunit ribosomal protein L13
MMKSYMARPLEVERKWYVVDAEGQTLGRLATEIARILRGKNKPQYTPHVDLRRAVKGMMPKNRLARQQLRKLKIYAGPEHPHAAQNPQQYEVR